jgi:WD40 repeat protein
MLLWATLSPEWHAMASVGRNALVQVYSTHDASLLHRLVGHEQTVYRAIFSPDGQQLASVSWDATLRLWDLHSGGELFSLRLPTHRAPPANLWDFDFRCTPTGCWIAVPLTSGKLALYDFGSITD